MTRLLICLVLLSLGLAPAAAAQQTGRLEGIVLDAETQEPLIGANVALQGTIYGSTTNTDGAYRIDGVPAGAYTLLIRFVGYDEIADPVEVEAGGVVTESYALEPVTFVGDEVVVTGSRAPEKVLDAPVTIEVVTAEDLNTTGGGTFLAALKNLKGIDFAEVGINGQGISARGFNNQFNTRMLAMTDGRVAQLPGTGLPQGNFLPTAPLDVKSIEVVVGPASALYGPNAHTGVVNVITKDPWDEAGVALALRSGQRSLLDGNLRAAGTVGGNFGWKLTGQYLEANDFEPVRAEDLSADASDSTHYYGTPLFEGELLDDPGDYDIQSYKFEGNLYYRFAGWTAKAGYGFSENDNFGLTNNGRNRILDWQVQFQNVQLSSANWYLQATRTTNDAGDTYQLNQVAGDVAALMGQGLTLEAVNLEALREANGFVDNGKLWDTEVQYRNALGGVQVTTGLQYRRYLPDSDGTFLADANDEDIDATEFGGYLQLDTRFLQDRLRLVGAARLDDHSNYDLQFSPKLAATYTLVPGHNLRVGYNRAFKSPTILENNLFIPISQAVIAPGYYINAFGNADGYVIRDPEGNLLREIDGLNPEEVNALELGYKGVFSRRLFVDLVGYYSWYQNFISPLTFVADGVTQIPFNADGTPVQAPAEDALINGLSTYVNFGEAEVAGLDLGLSYYASDRLNLSGSVSLISLESFTNEDAGLSDLLLNVPTTKLKGSVTVSDVGLRHSFVSLSGRWQSEYAFESGYWSAEAFFPDNDGEIPSRFVMDVAAGYDLPVYGVSFKASVTNVFDNERVDVLGSPIRGRFAWISIAYTFNGLRY